MHYPAATDPKDPPGKITVIDVNYTDTWRAMEECVKLGLVRNIGISSTSLVSLRNSCADDT
jgi:diketogulonate reductase-like aldo/keto reductase